MFDFMRNLAKPAGEKQSERLHAYIDGELSATERQAFETQLAADPALQAELDSLRQVKAELRSLPPVKALRNFTLDPAVYGRPEPDRAGQLMPVLRMATALTAVLFVSVLVLDLLGFSGQRQTAFTQITAPFSDNAPAEQSSEIVVEGEPVEVTRLVTEMMEVEVAAEEEAEESTATGVVGEDGDAGVAATDAVAAEDAAAEDAVAEVAAAENAVADVAQEEATAEEEPLPQAPAAATASLDMTAPEDMGDSDDAAGEAYPPPATLATIPEEAYISPSAALSGGERSLQPTAPPEDFGAARSQPVTEEGEGVSTLRLAQFVLGIALLLFLTALLVIRRQ